MDLSEIIKRNPLSLMSLKSTENIEPGINDLRIPILPKTVSDLMSTDKNRPS